jgi:hypothetical protein
MADLPAALLRSITWDQGTEMARHLTITKSLGAAVLRWGCRRRAGSSSSDRFDAWLLGSGWLSVPP